MKLKRIGLLFLTFAFFSLQLQSKDNNIKVIFFDFGGFAIDQKPLLKRLADYFAPGANISSFSDKGIMRYLKEDLRMSKLKIMCKSPKLWRMTTEHIEKTKIFDNVKNVLQELSSRGYSIKVLSSIAKEKIENKLDQEGLKDVVECISSGSLINAFLKRKAIIKKYLKSQKLAPNQALYIGDEVSKVKVYQKVGVKICAISWGLSSKVSLLQGKPNFLIDKPEELLGILQKV